MCCKALGAQGQPCHYLACGPSVSCPVGAGTCSDGSSICVTNTQCAPESSCCVTAGAAYQPCRSGNQCDAMAGNLVCAASTGCPGGLSTCCLPAGQTDQPCLAGNTCNSGFCVSSQSCPGGLDQCCKPAVGCAADGTCADSSTVCAFSTRCGGAAFQCCAPWGSQGQACGPSHACSASLTCVQDPTQCPDGLQECCLDPGAAGQPCIGASTCANGLSCFSGMTYGGCGPNSSLTKCCLPSGHAGERCNQNGTCASGLACLWPSDPNSTTPCTGSTGNQCCREVLTGNQLQPCGASDACNAGLFCLPSSPNMLCQYQSATCCQPAGAMGTQCKPGNTCDSSLTCGSHPGVCPSWLSSCCG